MNDKDARRLYGKLLKCRQLACDGKESEDLRMRHLTWLSECLERMSLEEFAWYDKRLEEWCDRYIFEIEPYPGELHFSKHYGTNVVGDEFCPFWRTDADGSCAGWPGGAHHVCMANADGTGCVLFPSSVCT